MKFIHGFIFRFFSVILVLLSCSAAIFDIHILIIKIKFQSFNPVRWIFIPYDFVISINFLCFSMFRGQFLTFVNGIWFQLFIPIQQILFSAIFKIFTIFTDFLCDFWYDTFFWKLKGVSCKFCCCHHWVQIERR